VKQEWNINIHQTIPTNIIAKKEIVVIKNTLRAVERTVKVAHHQNYQGLLRLRMLSLMEKRENAIFS
jgi:hypothetical protein